MASDSTTNEDAALKAAIPPPALGAAPGGAPSSPEALALEKDRPPGKAARPPRAQLHFVVIVLLCVDVVLGLGLAVFAEKVLEFEPMAFLGLGLAALGLGILAYFVLFGDGRAKPRS